MGIDEEKIIYKDFIAYPNIRKLYEKICSISNPIISIFEKDNNLKIQLYFNKTNTQLSLYHYLPDNRVTQEMCLTFVENLNDILKNDHTLNPLT